MLGVVVRYAKGRGFLMDEHLAKVWVCSQLTNIIRNLSEEQAGISLHSQWICAECRTALPLSPLQRKRQLLPQRSTIRITSDDLVCQYTGLLIAKHCGETAQLFGDLLICAAARRHNVLSTPRSTVNRNTGVPMVPYGIASRIIDLADSGCSMAMVRSNGSGG